MQQTSKWNPASMGLLAAVAVIGLMAAGIALMDADSSDAAVTSNGITYEYSEATRTLTISGNGPIADYNSIYAPEWAKYYGSIDKIVISEGITRIGMDSLAYTGAKEVYIADTVTSIGRGAFYIDTFDVLSVPAALNCNGDDPKHPAFNNINAKKIIFTGNGDSFNYWQDGNKQTPWYECSKLHEIEFAEGVTSIGSGMFYSYMGSVNFDIVKLPSTLTKLGLNAFLGCSGISEINLEYITDFGYRCLEDCTNIDKITFNDNIQNLPSNAFYGSYFYNESGKSLSISAGSLEGKSFWGKSKGHYYQTTPEDKVLSVRYLCPDGYQLEKKIGFRIGEHYDLKSPEFRGYRASLQSVSGVMTDSGFSAEVVYTEEEPTDYTIPMVAMFVIILVPVAVAIVASVKRKD